MPVELTSGWVAKSPLLLFETSKLKVWPDSFGGPFLIEVAQPGTVCVDAFSETVWSLPALNDGASLTGSIVIEIVAGADESVPSFAE